MVPPTPLKKAKPKALSNDPASTTSSNTSIRRSGRHSSKNPVNYYQPAIKSRSKANPPAKRQKISDTSYPDSSVKNSPTAIPTANHNPTPSAPCNASKVNPSNQSLVATSGSDKITGTHLQTAPQTSKRNSAELSPDLYSKSPSYQSPAPAPRTALDSGTSLLPRRYHRERLPRFTALQIRDLLRFNSNKVSRRHFNPDPKPSVPTATEDTAMETRHLRTLVRAAASHYASLPREYGDLESCLPHLYKTFIPTAKFESWMKANGNGMRERDIHVVLMAVFEVVFLGWFSCAEAEEKIWGLLGFEEEEEEGGDEWEEYEEEEEDD
ncbi:hypothetical protein B9Z19DRAFT_1066519 [Tuber borchii]|uniref:Uncharacterized protein n=1 Tax=Tuber borchii TaxID=42251 RepID=A0A2T6ZM62_TUBBO|nr:hypothetical protein B9Z19DRAFT_1066519 [Tuber borchii]